MTDHHTYGTSAHTVGVYHLASSPNERTEIQSNPIPGDDGEDDLYAPEHPAAQVLLLATTPVAEPALQARLGSIEGLILLSHETV